MIADIRNTLNTLYQQLPQDMSKRAMTSALASVAMNVIFSSGSIPLAACSAAGGAISSLASDTASPVLNSLISAPNQHLIWVLKCAVGLAVTASIVPGVASLFGVALRINYLWTFTLCILQLFYSPRNQREIDYTRPITFIAVASIFFPSRFITF